MLANNQSFQKKHKLDTLPKPPAAATKTAQNLPGGGIATGVGSCTGTNCPAVTISADPATVTLGGKAKITWSSINNPTSCVASDDWTGTKSSSGSESTPALTKSQNYLFTLTCKNATGTGFSSVSVATVAMTGGTGSVVDRPHVNIGLSSSTIYTGGTSAISWEATNNPTSCTATGDWSGTKASKGSENFGPFSTPKTLTYNLQCTNASGTSELTSIKLSVIALPAGSISISIAPTPYTSSVTIGSQITLAWDVTPTPKSCTGTGDWSGSKSITGGTETVTALSSIKNYTYNLTCLNADGNPFTSTAIVAALPAQPNVTLSASPAIINKASGATSTASTVTWTVHNYSPGLVCTKSGSWSGSLTNSTLALLTGTFTTPANLTAGTYTYGLSCNNEAFNNATSSTTLTINNPPAPTVTFNPTTLSSITQGATSTFTWTASNIPDSCSTAGSTIAGWAGATPASSGSYTTSSSLAAGTYVFNLNCTNVGGTGSTKSVTLVVNPTVITAAPVVTFTPSTFAAIAQGSTSSFSWAASNAPTSCSTTGSTIANWAGVTPATSGSYTTLSSLAAGTYTFTMTCTNGHGTPLATTASLVVVPKPTLTFSLSTGTYTIGSTPVPTMTWSTTNATTCAGTAGTQLSGSLGLSGSGQTLTIPSTAGTYTWGMTCSSSTSGVNQSVTGSGTIVVSAASTSWCNGLADQTKCLSPSQLATYNNLSATPPVCWGENKNVVIDIVGLNNGYHKNNQGNLLPTGFSGVCGVDISGFLNGGKSISGIGSNNHRPKVVNGVTEDPVNNIGPTITRFFTGYTYDATKLP